MWRVGSHEWSCGFGLSETSIQTTPRPDTRMCGLPTNSIREDRTYGGRARDENALLPEALGDGHPESPYEKPVILPKLEDHDLGRHAFTICMTGRLAARITLSIGGAVPYHGPPRLRVAAGS